MRLRVIPACLRRNDATERHDTMETQTDIVYEVIDPFTYEKFITTDHYIALHHYKIGYNVNENHRTVTRLSSFAYTTLSVVSSWYDDDDDDGYVTPNT